MIVAWQNGWQQWCSRAESSETLQTMWMFSAITGNSDEPNNESTKSGKVEVWSVRAYLCCRKKYTIVRQGKMFTSPLLMKPPVIPKQFPWRPRVRLWINSCAKCDGLSKEVEHRSGKRLLTTERSIYKSQKTGSKWHGDLFYLQVHFSRERSL